MPVTPADIKKAMVAAGFELYRTRGNEVQIADRVRDNLIMDSGVSVRAESSLLVKVVVRAQRSDFPLDGASSLFDRARELAASAVAAGYVEVGSVATPMQDPADPDHTLETWYQVSYEKAVSTLEEAMLEVAFALKFEKTVRSPAPTSS